MSNDNVAHPKHYTSHPSGVECIQITQHYNFNIGNAIKYLWRHGLKGESTKMEDLYKAKQYIDFEVKRLQELQNYTCPVCDGGPGNGCACSCPK